MARGRLSLLMAIDSARGLLMLSLLMESDMESATVPGPEDISTPPPSDTASAMALARGLLMLSLLMESATVLGPVDISTPPPSDTVLAMAMEAMARGLLMPSLLMVMES